MFFVWDYEVVGIYRLQIYKDYHFSSINDKTSAEKHCYSELDWDHSYGPYYDDNISSICTIVCHNIPIHGAYVLKCNQDWNVHE
jgi:hypothetical protein